MSLVFDLRKWAEYYRKDFKSYMAVVRMYYGDNMDVHAEAIKVWEKR